MDRSQKIYVVLELYWADGYGDGDIERETIDSIWSYEQAARIRIDDLENEFRRSLWYNYYHESLDDWYYKAMWDAKGTKVTCYSSSVGNETTTYAIKEMVLDPVLEDFTGF